MTRRYRSEHRQALAGRTRVNLVSAARRLLMARASPAAFTLEAVARRAGVTRLTVYHHFGSRSGLLEAVYDDVARRGRIAQNLAAAFQRDDGTACLEGVIGAFVEFWHAEAKTLRRLTSLAALDAKFAAGAGRNERRLTAMREVVSRLRQEGQLRARDAEKCAAVLSMLASFETYDALVRTLPDGHEVTTTILALSRAMLGTVKAES